MIEENQNSGYEFSLTPNNTQGNTMFIIGLIVGFILGAIYGPKLADKFKS